MSCGSKDIFKMHPVLCTNTHHDITDLVNHGMVKNTKTWISWKQNIIFLRNKKILKLCLRWHIFRSCRFLAEVTLKVGGSESISKILEKHHQISLHFTKLFRIYEQNLWNILVKEFFFQFTIFLVIFVIIPNILIHHS